MIIQQGTLEKLRELINEATEYRSGPKLVEFFRDLGFNDTYGQGFPSRWVYTQERLNKLNGTPELDKCIRKLFSPVNFIGRFQELDNHIKGFNDYLSFDNWLIIRNGKEITFKKTTDDYFNEVVSQNAKEDLKEETFLKKEFSDINLEKLNLEGPMTNVLKERVTEIENCLASSSPLSVIFLSGSTLEGILLGVAIKYPKEFNTSESSPKDKEGKTKPFHEWTLNNFIDAASEIGVLKEDVKKFSHSLRGFRNYIHPFQQLHSNFSPDIHTAKICSQVLKAAIHQISKFKL
ncbi:hypothetical protein GCM10007415_25330 [Parapedobacter pyrenivorans]|uniref:Uncharacterized protein n=1 Tax=Parapedobacter pyrenivorans TaxID=1305674 RepID=A0A917HTW4_9SPHI|nr:hypothetical protein [Parapedobacter pyrenivorans]GGG89948.1 hypothetical protein GCM10007415_25330 [Parapedobacter pyrenivorans]